MCASVGIVRHKLAALDRRESIRENLWGLTLWGEATREAPAQAELRPTGAGAP
jgi:hypothetical protein